MEIMEENKVGLSNDFAQMPVLSKHLRATQINNFGKVEYLRAEDFKVYIHKLKNIFCRCTPKVECFTCYKIKLHTGGELIIEDDESDT